MKKAENILESLTAQETEGLDWIEKNRNDRDRRRNETEEEKKLRLAKRRERDRAGRAASENKAAELMNNKIDFNVEI